MLDRIKNPTIYLMELHRRKEMCLLRTSVRLMTEVPKNFVVGPFFSLLFVFWHNLCLVSELRAVFPMTKASFLNSLIAPMQGTALNPVGQHLKAAAQRRRKPLLSSSWVQSELRAA